MKTLSNPAVWSAIGPWPDGLREVDNPFELGPTEFKTANRFDMYNGYLVKHPGVKILNYDHQLADDIDFLFRYNLDAGSTAAINSNGRETLIGAGTKLYAYKESNRTPTQEVGAVAFTDANFCAISWHDATPTPALIFVNGSDGVCKYISGAAGNAGTATKGISAADGYVISLFNERAWLWNLTHSVAAGAWTHANWGMFSARGDPTTFNDADIVEVGSDDETIMAVVPLPDSQVVITDKSIHHVYGSSFETISVRRVADSVGTYDKRSVRLINKPTTAIGFLAKGGYHFYYPDSGRIINVSRGLDKSFLNWISTERFTAVYDDSRQCLRLLHNLDPDKNRSLFVYGLTRNSHQEEVVGPWVPSSFPINITAATVYEASGDDQIIVVGDDDGYIYDLDGGAYTDEVSDGAGDTQLDEITCEVEPGLVYGRPEHLLFKKEIQWAAVTAFGAGTVSITIGDNKNEYLRSASLVLNSSNNPIWNTVTWNEFVWGGVNAAKMVVTGFKALPPAQSFKVAIKHSDAEPLILGPVAINYVPLSIESGA